MDNEGIVHYSYGCYDRTLLPSCTWFSGSSWGKISCTSIWCLRCSYLHPNRRHGSILMWLQNSDTIVSMGGGVDVTKPAIIFESEYRATMLTREEWTRGLGITLQSRKSSVIRLGPGCSEAVTSVQGQIFGKKVQYLSRIICYSPPGWGIPYLGLCLRDSK